MPCACKVFIERDAVAELFADAVLHQFVHVTVRQFVTFDVEIMKNQLAFDQLFQTVVEHVGEFLLKGVRLSGRHIAAAMRQSPARQIPRPVRG